MRGDATRVMCGVRQMQTADFLVYIVLPLRLVRTNHKQVNWSAIKANRSAIQANWNVI